MISKKKFWTCGLLTMMCATFLPLMSAKSITTDTKNENWVLISEDSAIHRKIDQEIESYSKESGKEFNKDEVDKLINKFNDVVNKKLSEVLINTGKIIGSKDMVDFTRMLHKRMKRAVVSATSKIISRFVKGEIINIESLGIEFVQSIIREVLLGAQ